MNEDGWTIDELVKSAAEALASAGVRAPNGRVSTAPDRRVIRWYATIGLLDRPLRTGGRTARYGERHLLQLVAVKRRQAEGHPLAAIQAELAGATDATLRRVADLPAASSTPVHTTPTGHQRQFWRTPTTAVAAATDQPQPQPEPGPEPPAGSIAPIYPVSLHPAATLTLPRRPDPADLTAIHAAARPMLDLLVARGLLPDPPRRQP